MKKILVVLLYMIGVSGSADILPMKHDCVRPLKPINLSGNKAIEKFNSENQQYKTCINDFIQRHQENATLSTNAINKTINEWNAYVQEQNKGIEKNVFNGSTGVAPGGSHNVGHSDPTRVTTGFKF